ncbi:hypothetical protein [uncultured Clostridium sp.]|uniref:hypothetical protein n=1 Tax=uncultured Clostridium sp. TaxID=59620 RepID=UPI0025DB13CC|nr:hypothetical protein [uncultured Clostridium sp.]
MVKTESIIKLYTRIEREKASVVLCDSYIYIKENGGNHLSVHVCDNETYNSNIDAVREEIDSFYMTHKKIENFIRETKER